MMSRLDKHRLLSLVAGLAALAAAPLAVRAQAPQAAAVPNSPPAQTTTAPQPQATPEEVGDALMARHRYQAAIQAYKQGPGKSADVWNKLGIANQLMLNWQEAVRCYRAALRLEPRDSRVLNNLGTVYDSQKQYGDAQKMYRKALKIEPGSALIHKNLGTALMAQHKYKKGWEMYQAALAIDPHIFDQNSGPRVENPTSLEQRGAMNYFMARGCVRAGMTDRAIEYLRMALNEGFTSPQKIATDSEFAVLRGIPAFDELLAGQKEH
ncbi:MAG: tetratricopeptide repeat protein [Acidobacteriota bacterium]|nr:tetratricopeptide repeat protein [Acidobacteriota bacterium]